MAVQIKKLWVKRLLRTLVVAGVGLTLLTTVAGAVRARAAVKRLVHAKVARFDPFNPKAAKAAVTWTAAAPDARNGPAKTVAATPKKSAALAFAAPPPIRVPYRPPVRSGYRP